MSVASDSARVMDMAAAPAATSRSRRPINTAGAADPQGGRARPAVLRRQEPRLLGAAVDRLGRLFHPPLIERARQCDGRDVHRPHAAADRDRLFADPADGVAVPAADHDARGADADPVADRGDARVGGFLGDRDMELCDLHPARIEAGRGRILRRDPARFRAADGVVGALLRDQLLHTARRADRPARASWKARPARRSWRCCATS